MKPPSLLVLDLPVWLSPTALEVTNKLLLFFWVNFGGIRSLFVVETLGGRVGIDCILPENTF